MNNKIIKTIKYINFILIITLAIISLSIFNKKVVLAKKHHFKCYQTLENNEQEIKYNYYFNIDTDEFNVVISSEYVEEFLYKNKEYYESAKLFYMNNNSLAKVTYNDKKQVIKIKEKMEMEKDNNYYDKFIETRVPSSFVCEELL